MANLDPTFRSYSADQAAAYAEHRGSEYASPIIQAVLSQHQSRGGRLGTVMDVGCGTGSATRSLAPFFDQAVGCDPGDAMVKQAQSLGGPSKSGRPIAFEVLPAEQLSRSTHVAPGSVDLLTAAMAAHWFHMDQFWEEAARMVRPGGTVAFWTMSSLYCHPDTPNAKAVQAALSRLEDDVLGPYELPQNRLSRNMYSDLALPWAVSESLGRAFPEERCVRQEWNRDGRMEPGQTQFFGESETTSLAQLSASLGTASMVTRWREAHPQLAGTDEDCVAVTMRAVAEALQPGVSPDKVGSLTLSVGGSTTLLLFTRSSCDLK